MVTARSVHSLSSLHTAIVTDCIYDTTVINSLLWKWLQEDQLTIKREIDANDNVTFSWDMKYIDTGSFVASTKFNAPALKTSETYYLEQNNLIVPDTVCQHTHKPDDDCERMSYEFLLIWNNSLEKN